MVACYYLDYLTHKNMNAINLISVSALLLMLSACGGNTSEKASAAESETTAEVQAPVKAAVDPVIVLKAGEQIPPSQGKPVVIDFNATWCGPCRKFAPHFDKVAAKYASKAMFVSVDVDKLPELAAMYGVQGIPTIIYISPDGAVKQSVGYLTEAEFDAQVAALLK